MYLDKDTILGMTDLPLEEVNVPEWNGTVFLRGLSSSERDAFEQSMYHGKGKDRKENFANMRSRLVILAICNDKGERLFSDADAELLGKKSGKVIDRLFTIAQKLSGIGQTEIDELVKD